MMKQHTFGPGLVLAAFGFAALLSAGACSNNNGSANRPANNNANTPTDQQAASPSSQSARADNNQARPINLTGCLQQGDSRSSFILTEINEPSSGRPAATSGSTSGDRVAQEQLNAAEHAYRLNADNKDDLTKLVGKRVRVSGTVTEQSDLARNDTDRNRGSVGTSGEKDNGKHKISESDLAKVDVSSIEKVADACGSGASGRTSSKRPKSRR